MRDLPIGNGSLLINFDDKYQIRDVYFPHVGQENHSEGFPFRFGFWINGEFSWVFEDGWVRTLRYLPDALVTDVTLVNEKLGVEAVCNDLAAIDENIFLRRVTVRDLLEAEREIRVFLHQDFRIYENKVGDTAFYDPDTRSLIHYKKHRYFLINTLPHFDQFATGRKAFRNLEGTWRDAEDGELHGGAITEGSVDSTIAVHGKGSFDFYYWIAAGTSREQSAKINRQILESGPDHYFTQERDHWPQWLKTNSAGLTDLSADSLALYRRSLLIIRTQIDAGGAIIAANDHDVTDRATDHYSYLWPRDGAFVANALSKAGKADLATSFFTLCTRIIHERGYFLQKYNADGTVGSGWHAYWDKYRGVELLPIQEDETALVLWALWEHLQNITDPVAIESAFGEMIRRSADFLLGYRDRTTGLPLPSWNLWEDRRGVHTFTCSTVVAGLRAAANFSELFGDADSAAGYRIAADEIVAGMREHLYSRQHGRFLRSLQANGDDELSPDATVDASLFGIFYFGCFDVGDETVMATMEAVEKALRNKNGGVARFDNDGYMVESKGVTGNSWIICTLWLAEYYIAKAAEIDDLTPALELINWVVSNALPSGVLPEQIDPVTNRHLSVSPLTWSHSTFVATVLSYQAKLTELSPATDPN